MMSSLSVFILLLLIVTACWLLFFRHDDDEHHDVPEHDQRVSPLLRGIHHLISDKPELALQEMVEVAKLRSESTEVYMALGEMFLSQGEIGRAVRIHQNILARPEVPQELYLHAHFALGKDFQTGGLLDRALRHYQKVLDVQSDHVEALSACLRIREQSQEWEEAEFLLSRIERIQDHNQSVHRAYLWAERAELAMDAGDMDEAEAHATQALTISQACTHAYLIWIRLAVQRKDEHLLQQHMQAMEAHAQQDIHLLVDALHEHYPDILLACWQDTHNHELALTWLEAENDATQAQTLLEQLCLAPQQLSESLRLIAMGLIASEHTVQQQAMQWRAKMKRYHCQQCGVALQNMHWKCPQCHTWGQCCIHQDNKETL